MTMEDMRRSYTQRGLSKEDVSADPLVQFDRWFEEAKQASPPDWFEINAMTLSTSSQRGEVSSRIVLLKLIQSGQFYFFTNYDSIKGNQIEENPRGSLCFFWAHLERQVRVDGILSKCDRDTSVTYFRSRPRGSQIGAYVSQQSSELDSREELQQRAKAAESEYEGADVPCPNNWGGYALRPNRIEFWQGRENRLHDRIVYIQDTSDTWAIRRLAP